MRQEFINAVKNHQSAFGVDLTDEKVERLADYYELVQKRNPLLHLVGPCSPEEFAIRHVLESLTLLEFLPKNARFADIGAGAGLPSIPCLLVRDDLKAVLIESKLKKIGFLREALAICEINDRSETVDRQFSEIRKPDVSYVACRALDKFSQKLPQLLKWSNNCNLLFLGGNALRDELKKNGVSFSEKLVPMSEQRFLFTSIKR
jgi:16S rRNA (guanine527-N7)-methyltransferase